jgi:hypothetical protein
MAPFLLGGLVGVGFGTGVTKQDSWPDPKYRIPEMEPLCRNGETIAISHEANGLIHTSPGQRPGFTPAQDITQPEGLPHHPA